MQVYHTKNNSSHIVVTHVLVHTSSDICRSSNISDDDCATCDSQCHVNSTEVLVRHFEVNEM